MNIGGRKDYDDDADNDYGDDDDDDGDGDDDDDDGDGNVEVFVTNGDINLSLFNKSPNRLFLANIRIIKIFCDRHLPLSNCFCKTTTSAMAQCIMSALLHNRELLEINYEKMKCSLYEIIICCLDLAAASSD